MLSFVTKSSRLASCRTVSQISRTLVTSRSVSNQHQKDDLLRKEAFEEENARLKEFAKDFESSLMEEKLTDINVFRKQMEPIGKNLFRGKVDPTIFSYPDVLTNDRYFALEKRVLKLKKLIDAKGQLLEDSINQEGRIPKDILLGLRSQGFYGLAARTEDGGEGLTVTETLRLLEELAAVNLSLSETVAVPLTMGYSAIQMFGSEALKAKYLPKMISGNLIGAVCIADDKCGCDPDNTTTMAIPLPEESLYHLHGKKTWVTNGPTADVFTVFANVHGKDETGVIVNKLTAFVVDRNSPGLTVHLDEREPKLGLAGLETCAVSFNNTPVPEINVLLGVGHGNDIVRKIFEEQRLASAARIAPVLRKLINETVKQVLARKVHGNALANYDQVRSRLADCACHVFALESAVYMTAGLADYQLEPDVDVDAAMTKYFAVEAIKVVSGHCFDLLGNRMYRADNPIRGLIDDLQSFN